MNLKRGSKVRLEVPENPRVNGAPGIVEVLHEWGAEVRTPAAATGRFRALFEEMSSEPEKETNGHVHGYSGNICPNCSGVRMRRNGTCEVCDDCGSTSGCS